MQGVAWLLVELVLVSGGGASALVSVWAQLL